MWTRGDVVQNTIAIMCDCDGTLCSDTTDRLVLEMGLDLRDFWAAVSKLVEGGWDPPLAYLDKLLSLSRAGMIEPITRSRLQKVAKGVRFYPGALEFVEQLRQRLHEKVEFRDAGVVVDWYIVSSGIEEILRATTLGDLANDVFACAFDYDTEERATVVKRAVTFTEKTKFVFAINKGISGEELRRRPYRVNDAVQPERPKGTIRAYDLHR